MAIFRFLAAALFSGGCWASSAQAGRITEVFLAGGPPEASMPNAVELGELAGLETVDLVVINASLNPQRYGQVLQVVTVPVTSSVLLISQTPWPDELWPDLTPLPPGWRTTLAQLGHGPEAAFPFNGPVMLLLFDRATGLQADLTSLFTNPLHQALLAQSGATLLDWLALGPNGQAQAYDASGRPVADTALGRAIARPYRPDGPLALDTLLVGTPDPAGRLAHAHPPFQLTPGWDNPTWEPAHAPEPGAWIMLMGGGIGLTARRMNRKGIVPAVH
ncbi:MAG TPA: hypothetical protein VF184_12275 [Phycisphaeraceae bacterium]